jgi:hypothetical protein
MAYPLGSGSSLAVSDRIDEEKGSAIDVPTRPVGLAPPAPVPCPPDAPIDTGCIVAATDWPTALFGASLWFACTATSPPRTT